ncbi:lipopolysaccharide assembly protein LapB [Prevotella sp. KH2C16]|uniref:tetratricopeptide repeat protein n=1 Tax=Prevotella sp. KH2C16 TaxID=1855325 RepID=UPI0008E3604A|nr:tetratricopeptide repeat protein [Prevotella sp. KH2C16]SFF92542.1 Tetratricopeptide repeat-containing protein [Prevotella sp. KH2C16]
MNFFKALFGGKEETSEEKKQEEQARNFDVLKYDGVKALRMNQWQQAIKCFSHALEIREDLECRDYLSQAFIQNNELLPAFEQLQKLAEAQPDNEGIYLRMAHVAYMMEDYSAMADACEKALLINKDDPQVLYLYARACRGQGDRTNALAMLTKAITLQENYGDAHLLRGEILLEVNDVEGAAQDADYLMEHASENEDVLLLKARVLEAKKSHDEAVNIYNKVIELNPFCIAAFKERGAIRLSLGDKNGAEEDLKAVLELNPDKEEAVQKEDIQQKTEDAYRNINPFGL